MVLLDNIESNSNRAQSHITCSHPQEVHDSKNTTSELWTYIKNWDWCCEIYLCGCWCLSVPIMRTGIKNDVYLLELPDE